MTKGKTTLIKRHRKKNGSSQLQTNNMPTDDVENDNGTNPGGYLLFTNKTLTVPWRTEGMPKKKKGKRKSTIHW